MSRGIKQHFPSESSFLFFFSNSLTCRAQRAKARYYVFSLGNGSFTLVGCLSFGLLSAKRPIRYQRLTLKTSLNRGRDQVCAASLSSCIYGFRSISSSCSASPFSRFFFFIFLLLFFVPTQKQPRMEVHTQSEREPSR